jgi:AcrR family transcriptional regulator
VAKLKAPLKGQARRGEERRAAIVAAAIEVFAVRGFRAGALAEVGERVGVSPAAILYHFGSKEELLLAVIAERDRRAGADLVELPPKGGMAALRGAVRFAEQSEREPGLTALHTVLQIESLEPDSPAHAYFQLRSRLLREWVEKTLRAAKRKGEIRSDVDCAATAARVVAFLEGAAVLWLVDRSVSLVALYRGFFDDLTSALS